MERGRTITAQKTALSALGVRCGAVRCGGGVLGDPFPRSLPPTLSSAEGSGRERGTLLIVREQEKNSSMPYGAQTDSPLILGGAVRSTDGALVPSPNFEQRLRSVRRRQAKPLRQRAREHTDGGRGPHPHPIFMKRSDFQEKDGVSNHPTPPDAAEATPKAERGADAPRARKSVSTPTDRAKHVRKNDGVSNRLDTGLSEGGCCGIGETNQRWCWKIDFEKGRRFVLEAGGFGFVLEFVCVCVSLHSLLSAGARVHACQEERDAREK